MLIYIVLLSILIQLTTALLALRLIRITGKQLSWILIAVAMTLQASRRIFVLIGLLSGEIIPAHVALTEWIGLTISVLMFAGVIGFGKILMKIKRSARERELEAEINLAQAALLDSAHDAILVKNVDDKIVYWNKGAERKYGWNFEEISDKITHEILKTQFPTTLSNLKAQVAEKGVWEGELTHTCKNGNKIVVNSRWVAHKDLNGRFSGILEINRDITARKQIEEEIRRLNERISTATRGAQLGIWDWDIVNNHLVWDDLMYTLYALNKKDFPGAYEAWLNGVHPEDREYSNEITQQAIRGEREYDTEFRVVWPDGSVHWLKAVAQVFFDDNKNPLRMVGINFDITERKRAEEQLKISEERYRNIFESAVVGLYRTTPDGKIVLANQTLIKLLGFDSFEDLAQRNLETEGFANDYQRNKFRERIEKDGSVIALESIWKKKNGQSVIVNENAKAFYDSNGKVIYYEGTIEDITDRKKMEKTLRESEEKFRMAFSTNPDSVTLTRLSDGMYNSVNNGFTQIFGYTAEEVTGKTSLEIKIWHDPEGRKEFVRRINENGVVENFEAKLCTKHGEIKDTLVSAAIIDLENTSYVLCTTKDITERKQIEIALQKSKDLFSKAFEDSPSPMTIASQTDGTYIAVNNSFLRMTEFTREEVIGKKSHELNMIEPEERTRIFNELKNKGQTQNIEIKARSKSGKQLYLISSHQNAELGGVPCAIGTMLDITERKHTEEALRESEERLRDIIFSSADWVWEVDQNGRYTYSSQRGSELFEASQEEIIGKTPFDFMPDEEAKKIASIFSELAANKAPITDLENWNMGKNGKKICLLTNGLPILERDGRLKGYRGVHKDITERKLAEQELINAKDKAEESDRLKSAFLANMSHEIRTPLNSILGYSDLLFDPFYGPEQQIRFVHSIRNSGENLLGIISDIMDISKIESGLLQITKHLFSITDLIIEIQKEYSYKAKEKGIEFQLDLPTEDVFIESDKARVRQILINLVTNAIKFTEMGFIEIGIKRIDHTIQMQVKDNGIGIPHDFHETIFERFRQVENADTRRYGGNGLGLAISKNLVEMLGGKIWIESEVGKGSTFYFSLPHNKLLKT